MAASKLFLLRNALRSRFPPQSHHHLVGGVSLRRFLTEGETPSEEEPFLRTPEEGLFYGKLTGIGPNTLKTDVINFLDGCNLSTSDIKYEYSNRYRPVGMLLQFSSQTAFDMAGRQNFRKGRIYKLERINRSHWDLTTQFDSKSVLLEGLPRIANQEDIERFFSSCNYDPSAFNIFLRAGNLDPVRCAIVGFETQVDAMNAVRRKNRSFCLSNPITVRLLH